MNVPTGELQLLRDQAARADEYHRSEASLALTLAAEIGGGCGPLSRDRVIRRLADALLGQGRVPVRERQSRVIKGGAS